MKDERTWDWQTPKKEIPVKEWQDRFNWIEEGNVSPDGEKIASIVNCDEAEFTICVNGDTWDETFEKTWSLRFLPDGRLAALVSNDEEWTACIDGISWETKFDYIWDLKSTPDGSSIGAAVQKDSKYGMAVNDIVWDHLYENITGMVLSDQGTTAAIVQVDPLGQADIDVFGSGVFAAAKDGVAQPQKFINIWDLSFDSKGEQIAYAVRGKGFEYSLVKNDIPWNKNFQFVWKPKFVDKDNSIIAPVRQGEKWRLFKDGTPLWSKWFMQLWELEVHDKTQKIAAIVSDKYGKWGVWENEKPWDFCCDAMISDLFYSENGSKLVAVFKNKGHWDIAVNGKPWNIKADKLWSPVFSPDNEICATRMEKKGKYYLVVNGKTYPKQFDMVFEPRISPDNDKVLLKSIHNGIYSRQILDLDAMP
jgi:hypothetical protein